MTGILTQSHRFLRRFRKQEDGSSTIEFALYFTVFMMVLAAGVEIAYLNLRHAMLERGVDLVAREIRLNTGHIPSYTEVRNEICQFATVLDECEANLRLEMVQVDPREFAGLPTPTDCQNAAQDPRPVRNFVPGQDNDLMLIRACLKFKPMIPTTSLGAQFNVDQDGYAQLLVTSAFVQEPR
ncbi:TadE/TadG family type IV pilus assembly protein [Thetidibacter halocola]|uniref:Pilus assembly protein n=1 Tax=Thetidibacter halocola TaxID=2827239 RepID=A0A8J8B7N6_9RHOB|nr:TadE/TadG family type IV pilus assembly protein [Thetidibacter halocola]MBS0125311.1 pilus assembly protein [Thetidibacter halocola]